MWVLYVCDMCFVVAHKKFNQINVPFVFLLSNDKRMNSTNTAWNWNGMGWKQFNLLNYITRQCWRYRSTFCHWPQHRSAYGRDRESERAKKSTCAECANEKRNSLKYIAICFFLLFSVCCLHFMIVCYCLWLSKNKEEEKVDSIKS